MLRIFLAIAILALIGLSLGCGHGPQLSFVAEAARANGFDTISSGEYQSGASSTSPVDHYWMFGGDMSFTLVKNRISDVFVAHGWQVIPTRSLSETLVVATKDKSSCVAFDDFRAPSPTRFEETVFLQNHDNNALARSSGYRVVILALVYACAG